MSRWSNPEKAAEFAGIYSKSLMKRYKRAREVMPKDTKDASSTSAADALTGQHSWLTEEGPVVIDVQGDTVVVSESLDEATTKQIEGEVFSTATSAK